MQKRRSPPTLLPVVSRDELSDSPTNNNGGPRRSPKRHPSSSDNTKQAPFFWWMVSLSIILGLGILVFLRQVVASETESFVQSTIPNVSAPPTKPLSQFPSLQEPFDESELVVLYFAASWCPMSRKPTQIIKEKLSSMLTRETGDHLRPLSLVYVSSDKDIKSYKEYQGPGWNAAPFEGTERADLKRHFATAAKREMASLNMTSRKHEIPTLIVLSGPTRQVLTYSGIEDLKEEHEENGAWEHWMELQRLNAALNDKFAEIYKDEDKNYAVQSKVAATS